MINIKRILSFIKTDFRSTEKKQSLRGIWVTVRGDNICLYYNNVGQDDSYNIAKSTDGFVFEKIKKNLSILALENQKIDDNFFRWEFNSKIDGLKEKWMIVPDYRHQGKRVMYYGDKNIKIAYSTDDKKWTTGGKILEKRVSSFDRGDLTIENVFLTKKGILILYHSLIPNKTFPRYTVGAALCDIKDPSKVLWRSAQQIWDSSQGWRGKVIKPVGVIIFREKLISYWCVGSGIYAVVYSFYKLHIPGKTTNVSLGLERSKQNPMIAPKSTNEWESFNTFNAATIYEGEKLHILYRAQGYNYISNLGYATSRDGISLDTRVDYPVFTSRHAAPRSKNTKLPNDGPFSSGGGYAGCEDPRLTKIGDRLYMVYVANDGWLPRLALTSISVSDFLAQRWFWEAPVLISPPGVIDKSGCILPEKIKGKYVIFHRIFPNILIDYVDSLDFDGKSWLKGQYSIKIRPDKWDSRKIGAGAPPLKTKDGWLLIYYGVDDKDASKYKIGAMLLDLKDPTRVLHRTDAPILEPDHPLENEGFKPGIAYPCGAVVIDKTLFVYYGGADSVVCVATADLDHFLSELKYSELAKMTPAIIRRVI